MAEGSDVTERWNRQRIQAPTPSMIHGEYKDLAAGEHNALEEQRIFLHEVGTDTIDVVEALTRSVATIKELRYTIETLDKTVYRMMQLLIRAYKNVSKNSRISTDGALAADIYKEVWGK